jgi:hypothetical protein
MRVSRREKTPRPPPLCAPTGHPRSSSAPRAPVRPRGTPDVSAPRPSLVHHAALVAHFTEGRGASWPSRPPRSPRHRLSPAAPTFAAGRGAQTPKRKFLSLSFEF